MLTNRTIHWGVGKKRAAQNYSYRQLRRFFFRPRGWYRTEVWLNSVVYPPTYPKIKRLLIPVSFLYFPELTFILLVIAQCVQFSSHLLVKLSRWLKLIFAYLLFISFKVYCNHEIKMGVTVLFFALHTYCIPWAFQTECTWKVEEIIENSILRNLHRDITIRTELVIKTRVQKAILSDSAQVTRTVQLLRLRAHFHTSPLFYLLP